jgi:hypothetical protein
LDLFALYANNSSRRVQLNQGNVVRASKLGINQGLLGFCDSFYVYIEEGGFTLASICNATRDLPSLQVLQRATHTVFYLASLMKKMRLGA